MMKTDNALEGITVIDCASLYAGPVAATMLGDFGAEVFKIELPETGDPLRNFGNHGGELSWSWVGRNKKSVPLDLHTADGQTTLLELVTDADVLIESFRPGTLERWGIGWETLSDHNPDLVMVRTSGFGQNGPYSDKPGFGTLVEAMSGFAHATGEPEGSPTLPPVALADIICAIQSAFAVMVALHWRDAHDGSGQFIDASILESMFGVLGDHVVEYGMKGQNNRRSGNRSNRTAPRNVYRTKDDRWVAISGSTETIAKRILRVVGGEQLAEDTRFETMEKRLKNADELDVIIADWMADRTREEVIEKFEAQEAAIGPVFSMEDIFFDPHFDERDAIVRVEDDDLGEVPMRGVFPKLSATPGEITHTGPVLGEHALDVLTEHTSLDESEVRSLAERGVTSLVDGRDGGKPSPE